MASGKLVTGKSFLMLNKVIDWIAEKCKIFPYGHWDGSTKFHHTCEQSFMLKKKAIIFQSINRLVNKLTHIYFS